ILWGSASSVNHAPDIITLPNTSALADHLFQYDVDAIDLNGDTLSFSLTTSPSGMTIDSNTGLISWMPSATDVGANPVTVSVSDGKGGLDTQSFSIEVAGTSPDNHIIYSDAGFPVNSTVYVWKGLNGTIDAVTDAKAPEGIYCVKAAGDSWLGWGIFYTDGTHDLSAYNDSSLSFRVKTPVDLKVNIKADGAMEKWISSYGWNGTNTWQRVVIPLSAFSSDLSNVESPFSITADSAAAFYVDYIIWGD
ncbi:MAG: putative Ig domain-containing protein, partial [Candidatus Aureabacteria bacterium]|nr:putative Ig domain-containing protein [Candidatus Auribacterota bacterium]